MITLSTSFIAAVSISLPLLYFSAIGLSEPSSQVREREIAYKAKTMPSKSMFKKTMTTIFWIGEEASAENAFIANDVSYWDPNWLKNFGGVDSPAKRNGYMPSAFTPRQNPFYVALPYGELEENGAHKESAKRVPGHWTGKA